MSTLGTIMPFGKYAGQPFSKIPVEYILWLVSRPAIRASHRALYLSACRYAVSFLKSTIEATEPSPPRHPGTPFRIQSAVELCGTPSTNHKETADV